MIEERLQRIAKETGTDLWVVAQTTQEMLLNERED